MTDKKIFAGISLRRLRQARDLSQAAMAEALGISPSYLNLVERNQRPLTAQLLLKLAETFDLDLRELSGENEARLAGEIAEALADPMFSGKLPQTSEIMDVASTSPAMAEAFLSLYRAFYNARNNEGGPAPAARPREAEEGSFFEEVRDYFHAHGNYIPSLDAAAEALHAELGHPDDLMGALRAYLRENHGIRVSILPIHAMPGMYRRFDHHNKRLFCSELLSPSSRAFQVAAQVALMDQSDEIDRLIAEGGFHSEDARKLCRIGLANYFAAALMMPYDAFLDAAEKLRYDLVLLSARFSASIEQVAHRLTSLQRHGRTGVPFFFLRRDSAGNMTKRFSAGRFPFARFGGTCPRWRIHDAFIYPGRTIVQPVALPDGATYLTVSRTVEVTPGPYPEPARRLAISIGCEIAYADRVVYGDGLDLNNPAAITPIGITCRLCERPNCAARVLPPSNRPMIIDASRKNMSAFEFGD